MTTLPLTSLLQILAEELRDLATTSEEMHELVCHDHLGRDPNYIRAVQKIDHTTQMLENLSHFVLAVGRETDEDWQITIGEALDGIRLGDLKRRLHRNEPVAEPVNDDGDLELFG
ncbi:hypothetical protein LQ948_17355 [Jiella sp. MQZ9-1]|uniref:Uncharacterized protein n=1 Tax=Jiella flava TaxID=2816857 RepID=A0A939FYH0_9HYPH|nr:hypothetical protein [Jiella flava]MBO0664343.1 hypothetical protein [Jiella flava]MCD2472979.1 hypothetical protein [Jiella flava]